MRATGADQRRFARLPFSRTARLEGPNGAVSGRLRDISLNGACLTLLGGWAGGPNARYRLVVELAPGTEVHMDLTLVHREGPRAGFRCRRLDPDSLENLKRVLALYYGDGKRIAAEVDRLRTETGQTTR